MKGEKKENVTSILLRAKSVRCTVFDIIVSCIFQTITIGVVYLKGYFNFSPAWLLGPLLFSAIRDKWKLENDLKHHIAMNAEIRNDKALILAHIDDLPSWIFFPDVKYDGCEWYNRILSQLWPNFSHYIANIIERILEPTINEALSTYKVSGFKFHTVNLGSVSPRICGVKVYEEYTNNNEIVIDMNMFYAGNCDFSFMLLGLSGGIQDFQMNGWVRIVLKPLLTELPLLGGIQIYFLSQPNITFSLVGAVLVLKLPVLNSTMHKVIDDQIASFMVIPSKLIFSWYTNLAKEHNVPNPEGVLRISPVEAIDLVKKETGFFRSKARWNPYVTIMFEGKVYKSHTTEDSYNPKWIFWAEFIDEASYDEPIFVSVFKGDDCVGNLALDVNFIKEKKDLDAWVQLEDIERGMLHLRMLYLKLSSDSNDYNLQSGKFSHLSSSVLIVYVHSAQNIVHIKNNQNPEIVVHIVVGEVKQTTKTVQSSNYAYFQQGFTFLIKNPKLEKLEVKLVNETAKNNIGYLYFDVSQLLLLKSMEIKNKCFSLDGTPSASTVTLTIRLRIIKNTL